MKRFFNVAVLVAVLGSAGVASANSPSYSFRERGDSASTSASSSNECGFFSLDVGGSDESVHQRGGAPVNEKGVWAIFWAYDWCKGVEFYGWGYGPNDTFDANMNAASAQITFEVDSYTWVMGETGEWTQEKLGVSTVSASVSWTGVGDVMRGMNSGMTRWGKNTIRHRRRGEYRDAEIKVDATLDGAPMAFQNAYGELGSYSESFFEIYFGDYY